MFSKEELYTIKWLVGHEKAKKTDQAQKRIHFINEYSSLIEPETLPMYKENAQTLSDEAAALSDLLNKIDIELYK